MFLRIDAYSKRSILWLGSENENLSIKDSIYNNNLKTYPLFCYSIYGTLIYLIKTLEF